MKIVVCDTPSGKKLEWNSYKSDALIPPYNCKNELMSVLRGGKKIGAAVIRWIGTHGDTPCFHGLIELFPDQCGWVFRLQASDFESGDIIRISKKDPMTSEQELEYWRGLTEIFSESK